MPSLTKSQVRLLSRILSGGALLPPNPDALRFRAANEDALNDLDELEDVGALRRRGSRYCLSLVALSNLREAGDIEADELFHQCEHVFHKLRSLYKSDPGASVETDKLAEAAEMPKVAVQRTLMYLTEAPIWSQHQGADHIVAITPKENILRYRDFQEVLVELRDRDEQKRSPQPREKHQKFRVLDSPALLLTDLGQPCGILGRAVLYIDLDDFKAINARLTETTVDRLVLPDVHALLARCVKGVGSAYGEGGDEFTILLPNASQPMALEFATQVRDLISRLEFVGAAESIRLTASIGVAHGTEGEDGQALKERANVAKNHAKAKGKNRVSVWCPSGPE